MRQFIKGNKGRIIAAAICLLLAAFFAFALVGYVFTAYILIGMAALIMLYSIKRIRKPLTILTIAGGVVFLAIEITIVSAARSDADAEAGYLIVMGAGVNGSTPSLSMVNRLSAALEYMTAYPDSIAIVSGAQGPGEDITEAEAMRVWLESHGVDPERIIKEEQARSTYENISFSLDIISELDADADSVALVSSEYHMYRCAYIAEQLGAEPVIVAGDTTFPVLKINYYIREAFAVAYQWVFGPA